MLKKIQNGLGKRERQIMEAIYRRKSASVKDVMEEISNPPSYSAVRATINILESKGFLKHRKMGLKYVYSPTISHKKAMRAAVAKLLKTYFNNSIEDAVASIIEIHSKEFDSTDFERLTRLIEEVKKESGG